MMGNIDQFKELKSFMANQPFDEGLKSYKDHLYPGDKIGYQKGIDQYFYYILDWQTRTYPYISNNWKEIIDYEDDFWEKGLDAVLNIVHPEDTRALLSIVKKWIGFIKNTGNQESINRNSISFDFRVVKKNGDIINILQQSLYTCLDKKGNIIYDMGMFMDITHFKNDGNMALRITGPAGNRILEYFPKANSSPEMDPGRKPSEKNNHFIKKVNKIIHDNLYDNEFSIQQLSKKMNMSRYQLHRKTKSMLDLPPNSLIRTTRLKKAAGLLSENKLSVSEIGYEVGFSSPTYFSKCFSEEFGVSPSVFRKKLNTRKAK